MKLNRITRFSTIAATALLCACGTAQGPRVTTLGVLPDGSRLSYDSTADTLTVSNGGSDTVLTSRIDYDSGVFEGYYVFDGWNNYGNYGETSSGSGYVIIVSSSNADRSIAATEFGRLGERMIPESGEADFTGDYVAWLLESDTLRGRNLLKGDASLTVDFDHKTVSGTIFNRSDVFIDGDTYGVIVLNETSLVNGSFSGSTSGGEGDGDRITTTGSGDFEGMITGPDGSEIVGAILIEHDQSGDDWTEIGGFIAEN